jgi:hypothetical protein
MAAPQLVLGLDEQRGAENEDKNIATERQVQGLAD